MASTKTVSFIEYILKEGGRVDPRHSTVYREACKLMYPSVDYDMWIRSLKCVVVTNCDGLIWDLYMENDRGKKEGPFLSLYDDGKVLSQGCWINSFLCGTLEIFNPDGTLSQKSTHSIAELFPNAVEKK